MPCFEWADIVINYKMDKNVQRLLEEEQEVNKRVQAAIEKKNELMKSIKKESEIAVRDYKKQLEEQYDNQLNKVNYLLCLTRGQVKKQLESQDTSGQQGADMSVLEQEFEQNKEAVIEMLIQNCMTVDKSIPRVVRGDFSA